MMRIVTCLLLIGVFCLHAEHTRSQNARVSLNHNRTLLETVLNDIEAQTDYLFIYNKYVDVNRQVSILVKEQPVSEVLGQLFAGTNVEYVLEGTHIVLSREETGTNEIPQQERRITVGGKITDELGEPVIGANVIEKGTANGTITGIDGDFSLSIGNNASLIITYVGYIPQEIAVGNRTTFQIQLREDTQALEEVVVVGYGVQKKKLVTGATVQVKGDDLQKLNTVSPFTALQSQAPGVSIIKTSGQPGEGFKIAIRGVGTTGNASPLYIIDGVTGADLNSLNPSDIESIDILKDAASAAIYGARAANGVVLVTTKQGREGKASISYDGYLGIQNIRNNVTPLNAQEYAMIMDEAASNSGMPAFNYAQLVPDWDKIQSGAWEGTNWLKEATNKNALMQNHALNITGGTSQSIYSVGLSYTSQEGIIGQPVNPEYDRYTFRINTEYQLIKGNSFDILKVGENLNYSYSFRNSVGIGNHFNNDVYNAVKTTPFLPVYDANGDYHRSISWDPYQVNPVGLSDYLWSGNLNKSNYLSGNIYLILQPVKGLILRSSFGVNLRASSYRRFIPVYNLSAMEGGFNTDSQVNQNMSTGLKWLFENTANYVTQIHEDHNLDIMVGTSAEKNGIGENINGTNVNLLFDDFEHAYLSNAKTIFPDKTRLYGDPWGRSRLVSVFGRINYDYKEKYMATLVMRADASSNFAEGKRWGYFPSVSAGWVITNEEFMQEATPWMDFLKLRVSWGQNGNQDISPFQYLSTIAFNTRYFPGIDKTKEVTAAYPNILANPDVTWETSEQTNIGVDARFLDGRLAFAFDWYRKDTKDWLVRAPILGTMGTGAPYINGGDVRNKGYEVALSWRDNIGDFNYGVNMNVAYNKNEVLRIANTEGVIHGPTNTLANGTAELFRAEVGYPIGYFWGYKTGGVFQNQQQIDNYINSEGEKIMPNAVPGDLIFVNQNDDNTINDEDKVMIGNPNPDYTFSLSFNCSYKGLDLNFTSNGVLGNQLVKSYRRFADRPQENYTSEILGRWHGEGTSNKIPRVNMATHINDNYISDRYVEDGDYWRFSNITIGYDFKHLWQKLPVQQARCYITGQNVLTLTNYSGFDPEVGYSGNNDYSWSQGVDLGFYPSPISFLFGISLKY